MFEDIIDDEFLGLIGMYPSEWIQINHGIFKPNQWKSQGAFEGLVRGRKATICFSHVMAFQGTVILNSMKATSHVNFPMRIKVMIFINKDFPL